MRSRWILAQAGWSPALLFPFQFWENRFVYLFLNIP